MKILDKYIAKQILISIFTILGILIVVVGLLDLVDELKKVDAEYSLSLAFLYVLLNIPQNIYEVFPIATLMGSLIGLSKLSSTSELNAVKSSGISFPKIIFISLRAGLLIMLFTFLIGEFIAPKGQQLANEVKNLSQSNRLSMKNTDGIWIKSKDSFIHIAKVFPDKIIEEVSLYRFNNKQQLMESVYAEEGFYQDNRWIMKNITSTSFEGKDVKVTSMEITTFEEFFDLDLFDIMIVKPNQMTLFQLNQYIGYLKNNSMEAKMYELAFWSKFSIPLSCLIMFLLTTPFVHSNIRSASFGQRVFVGILLGVGLFLFNQTMNNLSLIIDIPPLLGAFLPLIILSIISILIFQKLYRFKLSPSMFSK